MLTLHRANWLLQATLAKPPSTVVSMMKGVAVAYVVVILAYYSGGWVLCFCG